MSALAGATKHVRVGCLVFCVGYRNPGVLCKAAVTIDHVSGGRCELGIGAGWNENEFRAFGMPFLPIKDRLDQLEETAIVLRRLFDGERVTFHGKQVHVETRSASRARCRSACGSGSAGRARSACCASSRATPTAGTYRSWRPRSTRSANATLNDWCEQGEARPARHHAHRQPRARHRRDDAAACDARRRSSSSCSAGSRTS